MAPRFIVFLAGLLACALPSSVLAQPMGTFRWQLQSFCNVVTLAVTQNGAVYRLEGTDDQCGNGADAASVTGTAFPNADGTIGLGLSIVTTPGGQPLHVDAKITTAGFSGTWRDSAGATGAFVFTPGAGNGGNPRPLPSSPIPAAIIFNPDGGFVAGGTLNSGAIPASGPGVRAMWFPAKAAFRAGQASSTEWDNANVGSGSVAFGSQTRASGLLSTALGFSTTASGIGALAAGQLTTASASSSMAMGYVTTANGFASTALGRDTTASGESSTALGSQTTASGPGSTTMGLNTTASGDFSAAIGTSTTASGLGALAGGSQTTAGGFAALAFGREAVANGAGSVALGRRAHAVGNGSFVFADSTNADFAALGANEFNVRASGGVQIFSNAAASLGVALAPNATQWSVLSDARTKHRHRALDGDDVLRRIAGMPVSEWGYKEQDAAIRHIGPTAQDFHAAFGLGEDPLRIGTLDADGVALAGVKALEARSRQQAAELEDLKAEIARLRGVLAALTGRR